MKSKNFTFWIVILIFGFCILNFLIGCQPKAQQAKTKEAIPVKVSAVELKELKETIDYAGNIKAKDEAIVYPKVSGKIIEKAKLDGNPVKKGEAIVYLDRDEVGLRFQNAPVESPLTGVVGRVYVDIGENVTTQTPIALVVDMDKVKINLDVPEKHLSKITLGQETKAIVDAYPDEDFIGQVTKISPVVDLSTRTAPVEITLENPQHRLKSGMFAKVSLVIQRHKNIPVILKEAVTGKDPNTYVYVVEDNKAVLRKVALGIRQGSYYAVKEGLKEGNRVVIVGQQRLFDGADVIVEEEKE